MIKPTSSCLPSITIVPRSSVATLSSPSMQIWTDLGELTLAAAITVFADFKFVRTFFDATLAPVPFVPDPFKQADGSTPVSPGGISVPLSNPFNPFSTAQATLPDGTPVITGVAYRELAAGPRTFKTTTDDYLFDA